VWAETGSVSGGRGFGFMSLKSWLIAAMVGFSLMLPTIDKIMSFEVYQVL